MFRKAKWFPAWEDDGNERETAFYAKHKKVVASDMKLATGVPAKPPFGFVGKGGAAERASSGVKLNAGASDTKLAPTWRSGRDSNPRYPYEVHTISNRARYGRFDTTPSTGHNGYYTSFFSVVKPKVSRSLRPAGREKAARFRTAFSKNKIAPTGTSSSVYRWIHTQRSLGTVSSPAKINSSMS